jgi:hypothetical protein
MGRRLEGYGGRWKSRRGWWLWFWSWSMVSFFFFLFMRVWRMWVCMWNFEVWRRVNLFIMMLIRILDWLDWCSWECIERGKFIGEAKNLKIMHNISLTCSTLKMRTIWYGSSICYWKGVEDVNLWKCEEWRKKFYRVFPKKMEIIFKQ